MSKCLGVENWRFDACLASFSGFVSLERIFNLIETNPGDYGAPAAYLLASYLQASSFAYEFGECTKIPR